MSLRQFASEFVHEDLPESFVVRKDLLDSFTQWRQKRHPNSVMQLADLERASQAVDEVMPSASYRPVLSVTKDGTKGIVHDCWQGQRLTWANGNRTQPIPQKSVPSADVVWSFHYRFKYSPQPLLDFLSSKVTPGPENVSPLHDKLQRACARLENKAKPWCCATTQITHEGNKFSVILLCSDGSEGGGPSAYEESGPQPL